MKFVGSYVINRENVKFPDSLGKSYEATTPDSVRCLRDRALCRNKKLFAKILTTSIDASVYLKMTITECDAKMVTLQKSFVNIATNAFSIDDIVTAINNNMDMIKNNATNKDKTLKLDYDFINTGDKIVLTVNFNQRNYEHVKIEMNPQMACILGWDADGPTVIISKTKESSLIKFTPKNTFVHGGLSSIIYVQHPDYISTNLNNELITTICIKNENQLVYDQFFEIQSISPYSKLRFWIIDDKGKKRDYYPSELCMVVGFYEREF